MGKDSRFLCELLINSSSACTACHPPQLASTMALSPIGGHLANLTYSPAKREPLISDAMAFWIETIQFAIICEIIDVFGTITNVINIVIFIKLGFADPVNISLLGLAISDLCSLLTLHWHNMCYAPYFMDLDLPFDPFEVQYLTAGLPHCVFTRITATITAFITFERCLCVTIPLKVRAILNPTRVKIIIILMFVIQLCAAAPTYYTGRLGPRFFEEKNKTMIGFIFTENRKQIDQITFAIGFVAFPISSYIFMVVCTLVIVEKLREKNKWRKQAAACDEKAENLSKRDQKVTQMVVMISTLFIVCVTPVTCIFIGMAAWPDFAINGFEINFFLLACGLGFILESINSSMNIFIYYKMSTKYRQMFDTIFRIKRKDGPEDSKT